MAYLSALRRFGLTLVSLLALVAFAPSPASAHSHVSVGIGLGFPVYSGFGYGNVGYYGHRYYGHGNYNRGYYGHHAYRPHYRSYYRPYFTPFYPPVVLAPSVVYAPPVVYAAPVYQQPVQAVPTSDIYRTQDGQYCREYQSTATVSGRLQSTYGTACQDPDGTWRIVN